MSYKVLARKWRPQHFRDMIGQEPVLRALVNALDSDRLHHAYLFTGMRGVGKTTIARIFAKCLNCEANGVSSNPCGECSACKDIEAGRFFDLIEVDAASRTKVEETRELLENVPYAPASGRYKVYLIDEVHMFSNHSFNALLKTLEEPPGHVKFLLATTDPQKVPVTVLSRCLQFNLKRMAPGILTEYLVKILGEESIECERPALDLIARASEGSVRDSLSLVEQAAALGAGAVRESDVESMLGRASVDRLLGLIESLGSGQLSELFERVEQLAEYAPDFTELMGEILSLLHKVAMIQSVPGSVTDKSPGYDRLSSLANTIAPDEVQLFYQIGMHARRDMPFAPDPREAFDMALLRMSAFKPQGAFGGNGSGLAAVSGQSSASPPAQTSATPGNTASAAPSPNTAARQNTQNSPEKNPPPSLAVRGEVSAGGSLRAAALAAAGITPAPVPVAPAAVAPAARPASAPVPAPAANPIPASTPAATQAAPGLPAIDKANIRPTDWHQIVAELDISGMPRQLASQTELVAFANNRVQLRLGSSSEHLNTQRFFERVNAALNDWLGQEVRLDIALIDGKLRTPANIDEEYAENEMAAARLSIGEDPVVRQLIDRVDAAVDESSIKPIGEH
ncbi:MAG: DNA polymerase-3 subunit gamma/tau [Porticoccaceae bacterium]|jgi:DNA polymerase-3 subunit gamma/tau